MSTKRSEQPLQEACERFVDWLDQQVTVTGRGDGVDRLDVDPAATFWLGRLASEEEIRTSPLGDRADRLDPCAIGIRLLAAAPAPWRFTATVSVRGWVKDDKTMSPDPNQLWWRTTEVRIEVPIEILPGQSQVAAGAAALSRGLADAGAGGLSAEVRVEVEDRHGTPELVVQLVNTSPPKHPTLRDTHLYETQLTVRGVDTTPFLLEALPDTFRYDRRVPAYGMNVGIEVLPDSPPAFRTTDTVTVPTYRPAYWNSGRPQPDLSFAQLAADPLPSLHQLLAALDDYDQQHWSAAALDRRQHSAGWSAAMREQANAAAGQAFAELARLRCGLGLLETDPVMRRAFQLMNRAIAYSAVDRGYEAWRPFQIGFLLQALPFLDDPAEHAGIVDTVWFATGGGKTETYLGLLVTAALHDRLTGKTTGITAWSRFPLRLLSLQQTQRFADALAGAELVRRAEQIKGAPFALGFFVGAGGTPNRIVKQASEASGDAIDPDSAGMPERYQVLLRCPFCHRDTVGMRFDRRLWRLGHECANPDCPWPEALLPFFVVDQEIYRFLPSVVVGTLDKAASIAMQAAMRGFVGPPLGMCTEPGHGYTYAPRSSTPSGCLVPDCPGSRRQLPMSRDRYAPSLRLQDELHLLRDSLGAVDSHYESLLDHLQDRLGAPPSKIVASSATLTGYERQVEVLYQRTGRVFPQPGPAAGESFWTAPTSKLLRRFVAVAPRGVTLEHVSDRTINLLQLSVRRLLDDPAAVCQEAGIDPAHAASLIDLYGTDVLYGTTLYDVEAAQRSLDSNASVAPLVTAQLTGNTDFDEVRDILDRLERPEPNFAERIHVVAASAMLSHGVDIARLNTMVMLGLPLSTAEFVQTSARVGRSYPGLVHVLHKIGRERDAQTFRHFDKFVTQGDRFVEPIPITRRSRRVLRLTLPGLVEGRRLAVMEPASPNQRLTTVKALRDYAHANSLGPAEQTDSIAAALGFTGPVDELLREEIRDWLGTYFANLDDPASGITWPNELGPDRPMRSLRDVEISVPIHD
jgi:hypothetical protein